MSEKKTDDSDYEADGILSFNVMEILLDIYIKSVIANVPPKLALELAQEATLYFLDNGNAALKEVRSKFEQVSYEFKH